MYPILVIDKGNSHFKLTVLRDGEPEAHIHADSPAAEEMLSLAAKHGCRGAVYASVSGIDARLAETLRLALDGNLFILTRECRLPISLDYDPESSLGIDRIAGAAGGNALFPSSPLLLLDAGSALTADIVAGGAFKGGNISPGLSMRFRALAEHTAALPRVHYSVTDPLPDFGKSTQEAIRSGVTLGMVAEILGWIKMARAQYPGLKTIITGGHAPLLLPLLRDAGEDIAHEPLLVAKGLGIIYHYNEKYL